MNCSTTTRMVGSFDEPPLSEAVAVAKKLSEINRLRRVSFKAYPGMDHIPVKILLHIFLAQDSREWASVDDVPEAVGIRAKTVRRYLDHLNGIGLAEIEKDVTGDVVGARLTGEANGVVSCYLQAIAGLLSPRGGDHQ